MTSAAAANSCDELIAVVDGQDRVVGAEPRATVHAQHLLHRSVHILVFNPRGDVLVQLRGRNKDSYPLHWDVSVGGHVGPDEDYETAARRELAEELGLSGEGRFVAQLAASAESGWEFTRLYVLVTDSVPQPNPEEILRCEYVAPDVLLSEIDAGRRRATPVLVRDLILVLEQAGRGFSTKTS
ncbi:MAG: NUDIX domain-containing protein [Candidatus Sumerlaeia bacterium]|nr:NUDIX domain-containing protein [Candidatus Sumerlaeia bacterium]